MDLSKIKWSSKDYNLKELVTKFQACFPQIIKITEGFLGKQEVDSISSSTVLRIHSLYSQERAIAETRNGKVLSVPTKSATLKFFAVDKQPLRAVPRTLESILAKRSLPVTVQPASLVSFTLTNKPKAEEHYIDKLTISHTYQQEFLLGHSINSQGSLIIRCPVLLPMYMKQIKLVIAEGFEDGDEDKWNMMCIQQANHINSLGNMEEFVFQDVTLLDKKDILQQGSLYAEIEPLYIDLTQRSSDTYHELTQQTSEIYPDLTQCTSEMSISPCVNNELPAAPIMKDDDEVPDTSVKSPKKLTSVSNIPEDLRTLDTEELCDCLILLSMAKYADVFRKEQIDGQLLFDLERDMMRSCLGMNDLHISKLLRFRSGWRPKI